MASSSIRGALGGQHGYDPDYYTVAFIRHPWDRLVSALYSVFRSFAPADERLAQYIDRPIHLIDTHARPQWTFLEGVRVDFLGHYETLTEDWNALAREFDLPALTHTNAGKYRPEKWQDAPIDWERWHPTYARDFDLCQGWPCYPELSEQPGNTTRESSRSLTG